MALENSVGDCKEECRIKDGCEGFVMRSDTKCINLRDINIEGCERNPGFNFYKNGRYKVFLIDNITVPLIRVLVFI